MPPAARITDNHVCPKVEPGPVPHVGGPIVEGCPSVIIGFLPAARASDQAVCVGPTDAVATGSPTVIIGNLQAARMGDPMQHGGTIVTGFPTVIIGETGQIQVMRAAAEAGIPFCEECAKDALAAASGAT
jgi:uncharacterized Zn-binding protein involved in type VI secretion